MIQYIKRVFSNKMEFENKNISKNELIKIGNNLRGLLNDIKRRPEDAARELNYPLDKINAFIKGLEPISIDFIAKACAIWPLNYRDFFVIQDDCPSGVKIMRSKDSEESARIMERGGFPYYEYRDTVMTSSASFRPEWITELCYVSDNDPENKEVQWNNGHFMHQFTYFIGDVNFYYIDDMGKKKVCEMNTGDSCYITPFVAHSFTTRKDSEKPGLILALTYGNSLSGDAQQELASISNPDLAEKFALDFSSHSKGSGSLMKYFRESFSITIEDLSNRSNISTKILDEIEKGAEVSIDDLKKIANCIGVNLRDFLPNDKVEKTIIIKKFQDCISWDSSSEEKKYNFVELAATSSLPYSRSLQINISNNGQDDQKDLSVGLHQYLYNIGESEIILNWGKNYSETVMPGDSLYIKPFIEHNFKGKGKLLCLRIGGKIGGDPQRELSIIGKENSKRAISESMPWFNIEGKN